MMENSSHLELVLELMNVNTRYLTVMDAIVEVPLLILRDLLKGDHKEDNQLHVNRSAGAIRINQGQNVLCYGGLKGLNRALTKVSLEYDGLIERCNDLARFTIKLNIDMNFLEQFKTPILIDRGFFQLRKIKNQNGGILTHWVGIFDDTIIQTYKKEVLSKIIDLKSIEEKDKLIDSNNQKKKRSDDGVYYTRSGAILRDMLIKLKLSGVDKSDIIFRPPDTPLRWRFEIQFMTNEFSDSHFDYEWERLIPTNNYNKFKIQRTVINEMIEKLKISENNSLKEKYLSKLQELFNIEDPRLFNTRLLFYQDKIIDFR